MYFLWTISLPHTEGVHSMKAAIDTVKGNKSRVGNLALLVKQLKPHHHYLKHYVENYNYSHGDTRICISTQADRTAKDILIIFLI